MRLPNGYGNIHKLSGKHCKPWRARVTIGWDIGSGEAVQKYQTIGYYEKREEAIKALLDYNENLHSFDNLSITFAEVYEQWSTEHFQTVVMKTQKQWKASLGFIALKITTHPFEI